MSAVLEHLPALRVDFCRDADVGLLMRFIGTHWRAGHVLSRDEALLRWQFTPERLHGPPRPGPTVLLAWLDGEIVGMLGLTGFDFAVGARRFPAAWLSQWFTLPVHRRYNIALRLLWTARDAGVGALATLGANAVAGLLLARHGLELLPELSRWVAVFDAAAAGALVRAASRPRMRTACAGHTMLRPATRRRSAAVARWGGAPRRPRRGIERGPNDWRGGLWAPAETPRTSDGATSITRALRIRSASRSGKATAAWRALRSGGLSGCRTMQLRCFASSSF